MNLIDQQLEQFNDEKYDALSNLSNVTSFLAQEFNDANWVGFYILRDKQLELGTFSGKPACALLPYNTGVCWQAINNNELLYVPEVNNFPGHIACDSASKAELVLPLGQDIIIGVLDLDYQKINPLSEEAIKKIKELKPTLTKILQRFIDTYHLDKFSYN